MSTDILNDALPSTTDEIHALLEKCLINAYLKSKGYTHESLKNLPEEKAHQILKEASTYASGKLAEIEIRARFTEDLQESGHSLET